MPVMPGILRSRSADVEGRLLERLDRRDAVGADGHLVAHSRQFLLHQVAEVGLVIGERGPGGLPDATCP